MPRKLGPHEQLLSHLPTYRSSHPSHLLTSLLPDVSPYLLFLLLPLVLPPFPRRRPHCSTKRGREGTPLAQQDVDAKARRSLNKTFLYKDERRSLNKTLTRRHAARSTRLDDVDLDFPQQHAFPTSNSRTECNPSTRRRRESPHAVFSCCREGGARRSQVAAVAPDEATACRPFAR